MFEKLKDFVHKRLGNDAVLGKFVSGAFWAIFGNIAIKLFSLIASIFIARFLGNVTFGELSIVKTTLSVFTLLASFGLGFTITKLIGENFGKDQKELGKIISATNIITVVSGFLLGLILVLFSKYISLTILENENLIVPLRIAGAFLFFNTLNVYQLGIIAGLQAFKKMAKVNAIVGVISLPVLLLFTYYMGLNGTMLGLTVNLIINWALNRNLISKEIDRLQIKIEYKGLKTKIKEILKFSLPLAVKEIIYSAGNWFTYYLLLKKASFGEVGIFNSANQLSQIILFIPGAILGVSLSMLSNQKHDSKSYFNLIQKTLLFNSAIIVVVGIFMFLFSGLIYDFYGKSFEGGEYVLLILIVATLPMSLKGVLEQICISNSKPNLTTIFTFFGQGVIIISALIIFNYSDDATSLAYAYLIGYSVLFLSMYLYLKSKRMI